MPKLPPLSGRDVVKALERLGFQFVSQRGSHMKVRRGPMTVIVPDHREVRPGTLRGILSQSDVTVQEFIRAASH